MNRASLNRGDILTGLTLCSGIPAELAGRLCGFRWEEPEPLPMRMSPPGGEGRGEDDSRDVTPRSEREMAEGFSFWLPETLEIEAPSATEERLQLPVAMTEAEPVTNEDFLLAPGQRPLPGRPLVAWPRMWPFLREVLGKHRPGLRPDIPRVVQMLARGRALVRIPRRPRRVWHPQVHILRDRRAGLAPFWDDYSDLIKRLRRMTGMAALRISDVVVADREGVPGCLHFVAVGDHPNSNEFRPLTPQAAGSVVLVLGDLAQYSGREPRTQWLRLGRRLRNRGASAWALCPCPRNQWLPAMTRAWKMACWDRGERLPLQGRGLRGERACKEERDAYDAGARAALLTLCAAAVRVEPGLLRDLRFLLPSAVANVGTEFALFDEFAQDDQGFSLQVDEAARFRAGLAGLDDATLLAAVKIMRRHHEYADHVFGCMEVLGLKGFLPPERFAALIAAGVMPADAGARAMERLWRVAAACRRRESDFMAVETAEFHAIDAARQSAEMRTLLPFQAFWALSESEPGRQVPPWVRPAEVDRFRKNHETPLYRPVMLKGGLIPGGQVGIPLGWLASRSLTVFATFHSAGDSMGKPVTLECPWGRALPEERVANAESMILASGGATLTMQRSVLPEWAGRMGYGPEGPWAELPNGPRLPWELRPSPVSAPDSDLHLVGGFHSKPETCWADSIRRDSFGWFATFFLGGVEFVFRWIPPGTFLMRSAEGKRLGEPEGMPQHQVTISRGFWLGETPVTRAQWSAITELRLHSSLTRSTLKAAESRDGGTETMPKTSVNWEESMAVIEALNAIMAARLPDRFRFSVPSEAQWEYACRAGTATDFNDGSGCTDPHGMDPALDRLGWFRGNSGGRVHPVRQKLPNAWGLYDMHGNVWEWCRDAWDSSAYEKIAQTAVRDPEVTGPNSALRVVRGGSWYDLALLCRAAIRLRRDPDYRWLSQGLRLSAGQEPARPEGAGRKGGSRG